MISVVTQRFREQLALGVATSKSYAVLHHSEPIISDPRSTQVPMAGTLGVPVKWLVKSTVLSNSTKLTWVGITGEGEVPAWVAICAEPTGEKILMYGQPEDISRSGTRWDSFVLEAGTLVLAF